ncbi:MAG: glycosyltransferase family 2 protein [Ktedonobacteraceae bacterium]
MLALNVVVWAARVIGYIMVALVSIVGFRLLFYFRSFFFHWVRYRQLEPVRTPDILHLPAIPFLKIQITTRGSPGSTEVIKRGIQNVLALVQEAPDYYRRKLSVEVVTESYEQKHTLEWLFSASPLSVEAFVIPKHYKTPKDTRLKARGLHYMVELRRQGVNRKLGQTFIVHYDEESVMVPDELRKLLHYLAKTDKRLTEGPIYYPLEYQDASLICRAMEANRPVGCFECREVMESGTPLHMHGSNLVIDEELENQLGWDIGNLDGEPFIAEDYVFGVFAYLRCGPSIFGWHGCVMIEQPPFSFKSAFKQRYRWVVGVLQGMSAMQHMREFSTLPWKLRFHLTWGTRYRILTFALGLPTGVISFFYTFYQALEICLGHAYLPLPLPLMLWMSVVGVLWLNSILIGAWYNLTSVEELSPLQKWSEGAKVLAIAPIAGIMESSAAFWAVVQWLKGNRKVSWQPTPKTKAADKISHAKPHNSAETSARSTGISESSG